MPLPFMVRIILKAHKNCDRLRTKQIWQFGVCMIGRIYNKHEVSHCPLWTALLSKERYKHIL
ncbi:MAG: hypothetical protein HC815_26510 [Richelia sp. RM1_1_1]|nr:hypothetical protein [Richelia sp. SM1_7_0]NJN11332.1 hypothetical protein [Richelia sp. RM1_1_1]